VTDSFSPFLQGWVLGLSIAAPVGPIGVLCIRRTLTHGRRAGLASGLGAATADAAYGAIAGFGLTMVAALLVREAAFLRVVGGAFLAFLGLRTMSSAPARVAAVAGGPSIAGAYLSTFFLTLTNPMTILSFGVAFAGILARDAARIAPSPNHGAALVLGVFGGSVAWWLALTAAVDRLRERLGAIHLTWINRVAGMVLVAFGLVLIAGSP